MQTLGEQPSRLTVHIPACQIAQFKRSSLGPCAGCCCALKNPTGPVWTFFEQCLWFHLSVYAVELPISIKQLSSTSFSTSNLLATPTTRSAILGQRQYGTIAKFQIIDRDNDLSTQSISVDSLFVFPLPATAEAGVEK